jgi:glycosyltransferase involved in cell wall biosynthesis
VLVNDGSRDGSWAIMQELAASDPRLVAVNLSRNHGHQLALTAGLDLAAAQRILIIDADLQDPPELLPAMIAAMRERRPTSSMACARAAPARPRSSAHRARLLPPAVARDRVDIPLDAGDFRLMSRRALDALLAMPEQARFIRGMVAWIGFKQVPFAYDRAERLPARPNIRSAR